MCRLVSSFSKNAVAYTRVLLHGSPCIYSALPMYIRTSVYKLTLNSSSVHLFCSRDVFNLFYQMIRHWLWSKWFKDIFYLCVYPFRFVLFCLFIILLIFVWSSYIGGNKDYIWKWHCVIFLIHSKKILWEQNISEACKSVKQSSCIHLVCQCIVPWKWYKWIQEYISIYTLFFCIWP